jgi:carbonic anhydrase
MEKNNNHVSRRNLLKLGAGFVGTGVLTGWVGKKVLAQPLSQSPVLIAENNINETATEMTPDEALAKLMEGNNRFVEQKREHPNQDNVRLTEVATGQAPFAAILSCADSRVVPEIVFDQGIGDLFVVRVAGNVAMIEGIGSEEYGVGVLGVSVLMVLGHERCGAVNAALQGGELPGVIESLIYAIKPAVTATMNQTGDPLVNATKENVKLQVERLKTSAVIANAIEQGKLKVVGAYYDLDTGAISLV